MVVQKRVIVDLVPLICILEATGGPEHPSKTLIKVTLEIYEVSNLNWPVAVSIVKEVN